MVKRKISLLICVVLGLSMATPVFAAEVTTNVYSYATFNLDTNVKEEIDEDFSLMISTIGYKEEMLMEINNVEEGLEYIFQLNNGVLSECIVKKYDNGNVEFYITEGELQNTILLESDGTVYIDATEVVYNTSVSEDYAPMNAIQRADGTRYYTTTCPYGKASDYSDYSSNVNNPNIPLTDELKSLSFAALGAILTGIPGGEFVDIALEVAEMVLDADIASRSNSEALSYKKAVYYHKNGHFVMPMVTVDKNVYSWYDDINYGGDFLTTSITYYYHEYY